MTPFPGHSGGKAGHEAGHSVAIIVPAHVVSAAVPATSAQALMRRPGLSDLTPGHRPPRRGLISGLEARRKGLSDLAAKWSLPEGPAFKTVVVIGKPGRYGWSRRLRRGANCIVARWEGGDRISYAELESHLDELVKGGVITGAQREEFYGSIRKLDERRGGAGDLRSIRAFGKALSMRVVLRGREAPRRGVKPGSYSMTYWQAYRLARHIESRSAAVEVHVMKDDEENPRFSSRGGGPVSRPGAYVVRARPVGEVGRRMPRRMGSPDGW